MECGKYMGHNEHVVVGIKWMKPLGNTKVPYFAMVIWLTLQEN